MVLCKKGGTCSKCGQGKKHRFRTGFSSWCLRCLSKYQANRNKRVRNRNKIKLDEYKVERGCVDCGFNVHPAALEFHHIKGKKEFNISQGKHLGWNTILSEIAKCEVVCANCHRMRHGD